MKNNFGFILVKPQLGENIGACARSLKNFGFSKLNIVSNKTVFMKEISKKYKIKNVYDEDINSARDLKNAKFQHLNLHNYEWGKVIKKSGILKKICVE